MEVQPEAPVQKTYFERMRAFIRGESESHKSGVLDILSKISLRTIESVDKHFIRRDSETQKMRQETLDIEGHTKTHSRLGATGSIDADKAAVVFLLGLSMAGVGYGVFECVTVNPVAGLGYIFFGALFSLFIGLAASGADMSGGSNEWQNKPRGQVPYREVQHGWNQHGDFGSGPGYSMGPGGGGWDQGNRDGIDRNR